MRNPFASVVVLFAVVAGQAYAASPISKAEAAQLAERHGRPFLMQTLHEKGNLDPTDAFEQKRLVSDDLRMVHQHVRQTHGGVPVWGGEAIIHLNGDGSVSTITDDFLPRVNEKRVSLRPSVSSQRAIERAMGMEKVAQADLATPANADLWIFRHEGSDRLAWRVSLDRTGGSGEFVSMPVVFVDAHSGQVLWSYDNLQTGIGKLMYGGDVTIGTTESGGIYQLKDALRGNMQTNTLAGGTSGNGTLMTDADDTWGNNSSTDPGTAGAEAHYGAKVTWDYFKNWHNRTGIRNDGVGSLSRVHYGNAYVNAFWSDACFCMTYGDGSGNTRPLTSIDVAGHEMTHGVTSNTAGLIYSGESGGLNEATSDIFGTAVEFDAQNASDVGDYLIGEKININGNGTPLRYMDQPSRDGSSANCWSSTVGNLDVHYSSGVANHFFYLLSEGSGAKTINGVSYNSPTCNGSTVTGISRLAAEKIWYRALTTYMTSSTNYSGARTATLNAAADLYGAGGVEHNAVTAAWAAVNVSAAPPPPPSTPLTNGVPATGLGAATGGELHFTLVVPSGATNLSFTISGGTGDADMYVKFGSRPTTTSYDCRPYLGGNSETCSFAAPQAGTYHVMLQAYSTFSGVTLVGQYSTGGGGLQNGGFESTSSPWVLSGFATRQTTGTAHSGTGYVKLGGTNSGSGAVYQQFTVPSSGNNLRFWLYVTTSETTATTQYDKLFVEVRNTSGTLLTTLATYSNLNKGTAYSQKGAFSLSAYAGQTIRLQFRGTTDSSLPTDFRIDDVSVAP